MICTINGIKILTSLDTNVKEYEEHRYIRSIIFEYRFKFTHLDNRYRFVNVNKNILGENSHNKNIWKILAHLTKYFGGKHLYLYDCDRITIIK
uniref:Uncharacterized protein n=1 Tax=viral metagenome TaxID=1070528 RepID=A0A6C0CJ48_9ZZZZ